MKPEIISLPACSRLNELLRYDPESGLLYWLMRRGGKSVGDAAGSLGGRGHLTITIDGRKYYAHRVIWKIVHGDDPKAEVDHRDRSRAGNKLRNLREATRSQNCANVTSRNKGRKKGAYPVKNGFCSKIRSGGKTIHLGTFSTEEEASAAYFARAVQFYGEYARV